MSDILEKESSSRLAARRYAVVGNLGFFVLLIVSFFWIKFAELSGAIVSNGYFVVEGDAKRVQHPFGGVISEIYVKNHEPVKKGQILIRLDSTSLEAQSLSVQKTLGELKIRRARLLAERDQKQDIPFPIIFELGGEELSQKIEDEKKLFYLRMQVRHGRKSQLEERVLQLASEARGYQLQREATIQQIKLNNEELDAVRHLWGQKLVQLSRVSTVEREAARLEGVLGQLGTSIAQVEGKISETRLSILQVDQDLYSEVAAELREVDAKIGPLDQQLVSAKDQLARIEILAPHDGIIHQLNLRNVQGVISAGDTLMLIVPTTDKLVVDTQINPADVDQIHVGGPALIRLTAFSQKNTPELLGTVASISPDISVDQRTGNSFFLSRIEVNRDELIKKSEINLVPGIPVEVYIRKGARTVFDIAFKYIRDQMNRAYRN